LVPIEELHRLIDPLEILAQPAIQTANVFRLGVERDWIWMLPAALLMGFGAAGCFADLGVRASEVPILRFAGSVLLATGVAIAVLLCLMSRRQVWFDRNQCAVLLVEGRTLSVAKALANATRRSTEGFSHVRLCEREYAPELGSDSDASRTEYRVGLEGSIPFAFDDGRVHSRSDALHLASFSGERAARRFAAEVGYHVGLRILVASDW
jgi:hypothetical protein